MELTTRKDQLENLEYVYLGVMLGYNICATTSPIVLHLDGRNVEATVILASRSDDKKTWSYLFFYDESRMRILKSDQGETPWKDNCFLSGVYEHFIRDPVKVCFPTYDLDNKLRERQSLLEQKTILFQ
jgi:hypothetical protein